VFNSLQDFKVKACKMSEDLFIKLNEQRKAILMLGVPKK